MIVLQLKWSLAFLAIAASLFKSCIFASEQQQFYCNGDICTPGQFCSETFLYCRSCKEVIDECFSSKLPRNCSSTCIEHHVEIRIKETKAKLCQAPTQPLHGRHIGPQTKFYKQGDTIEFTCDPGYMINGAKTGQCMEYGVWSTAVPTCEEIVCPTLGPVKDGVHNGSLTPLKPGDMVVSSCSSGYRLYGENVTVCNSTGFWTNRLPVCAEVTCSNPHSLRNGHWLPSQQPNKRYMAGNTITARCDDGFFINGSQTWNCSKDGNWLSGDDMPLCIPLGASTDRPYSALEIVLITALTVSCLVILVLVFKITGCRKYCGEKDIEIQREDSKDELPSDDTSANEDTRLLKNEKGSAVIKDTISVRFEKENKEKVTIPRPNDQLPNTTPMVGHQQLSTNNMGMSSRSEGSEGKTSIYFNNSSSNNNNNINNNTCSTETLSTHISTGIDVEFEPPVPRGTRMETCEAQGDRGRDKTPVEESGTFQPTQPESTMDNTFVKLAEPSHINEQQRMEEGFNRPDQALHLLPPVQQTVNNEQDLARKLVLTNTDINTDDVNV